MARYTGAVCKLCRREGFKLFLKGDRCFSAKCALARRPFAPGQHGSTTRKLTQYGMQLRSKQALKRIYGLLELQFRKYFEVATTSSEETGNALMTLLESRLDNVIYKMGFASSRSQARQLVNHGHVLVNGRKVNKPSFGVKPDSIIEIKEKSKSVVPIKGSVEAAKDRSTPPWLEVDFDALRGTFLRAPSRDEIDVPVNLQSIIELYSK